MSFEIKSTILNSAEDASMSVKLFIYYITGNGPTQYASQGD